MSIHIRKFGVLDNGEQTHIYQLKNASGAYAEVCDFGALIISICVPDKDGKLVDVALGYDNLDAYKVNGCFFGAAIGRSGNRIDGASFEINGKKYQLAQNENENNLHSGPDGYEKCLWQEKNTDGVANSVTFGRLSPDGEQGYPGNFEIEITYTFTEENELIIAYKGVSDQDTIANLTNHSYFNLNGEASGSAMGQILTLHADYYTPVKDGKAIPTGEKAEVAGTPMDFRTAKVIGKDIEADFEQLKFTGGFDHNYCTNDYQPGVVREIAEATSEESGITMKVFSDLPCVQFYAGNFIKEHTGKNGVTYAKRHAFCLETQFAPDAIHQPAFESPILKAGETYSTVTSYKFS